MTQYACMCCWFNLENVCRYEKIEANITIVSKSHKYMAVDHNHYIFSRKFTKKCNSSVVYDTCKNRCINKL